MTPNIAAEKKLSAPSFSYRAKRKTGQYAWAIFRACLLIGVSFVLLYPILYMFSTAIKPPKELTDPSVVWVARNPTWDNIAQAYRAMNYPRTFLNTALLSLGSSVCQVMICMMVGYGFAQFRFRGRGIVFALVVFTIILPQQTIAIPMYLNFQNLDLFGIFGALEKVVGVDLTPNLLGTAWVYILPAITGMGLRSGLFIFIFRQFFRGMPKELADAARIDGCNAFQTFVRVMAPNASAAILTVFLFSMVWYWNEYFYPQMYLGGVSVMSTSLASLRNNPLLKHNGSIMATNDPYQYATKLQAGSLLSVLPLLIMYIFLQRYFTESIERTGLVG